MEKTKVILFGAGNKLKKCLVSLDYEYDILWICDNDSQKWGGRRRVYYMGWV